MEQFTITKSDLHILFAEDNEAVASATVRILSRFFEKVVHFQNGKEAYEYLEFNSDIDLVITDIGMPIMDGIELIKEIRLHTNELAPIIAVTAHATEHNQVLQEMSVPHITKPVDIAVLIDKIQELIPNTKSHKKIVIIS